MIKYSTQREKPKEKKKQIWKVYHKTQLTLYKMYIYAVYLCKLQMNTNTIDIFSNN